MIPFQPGELFSALAKHRIDFILVGGLAGIVHGFTGGTNDVDIVIPRNDETIRRLKELLRETKARLRIPDPPYGLDFDWSDPEFLQFRDTVNCLTEYGPCNIMFAASGIGPYEDILPRSEIWELWDTEVSVAELEAVIDSKEAADRPKDRLALPLYYQLRESKLRQTRPVD